MVVKPGERVDLAVQGRDDADGQGLLLAERRPDGDDGGAHGQPARGAEGQRPQPQPPGSTFRSATSENGSKPTIFAGTWLRSGNRTKTSRACRIAAPSPVVTTWAFVTTSPRSEITKPEPCPEASCARRRRAGPVAMIVTTPRPSRS
jgi:hypothetical protein